LIFKPIPLYKIFCVFLILVSSLYARDEKKRFLLHQDRIRVERLFRPFEHRFSLDTEGSVSYGLKDYADGVNDVAESDDVNEVLNFIRAETEKEHFFNAALALTIPLPRFRAWSVRVTPSIRGSLEIGGTLASTIRPGLISGGGFTASLLEPKVSIYIKQDIKTGLNLDWEYKKNHYGLVNIYGLNRWDREEASSKDDIDENDKLIDLDSPKNTSNNIVMDLKYGYRGDNFTIMTAIEEIQLATLSNSEGELDRSNGGFLNNEIDALFRVHGEYVFEVGLMDFIPYAGFHSRNGYTIGDGIYYGLEWIPEFISLRAGARIDSEYFNLSGRYKIGFLQLEYTAKIARREEVDGFEIPNIHLANIRFNF